MTHSIERSCWNNLPEVDGQTNDRTATLGFVLFLTRNGYFLVGEI